MKTLIIISTLLLLNCADNIVNNSYGSPSAKTWCSEDYYSNGEPYRMYSLGRIASFYQDTVNYGTKHYTLAVDSIKGDTTFVNTTDGDKWIVESEHGIVDKLEYIYDYGFAGIDSENIYRCIN